MTLTPQPIDIKFPTTFDAYFEYLKPLEEDIHFVYSDQPLGKPGVPTLGVGYALVVNDNKRTKGTGVDFFLAD